MIWTLTAWQVDASYVELVFDGLKTTLFCEPAMQSANESVSPWTARNGWPVPCPAGSVSACAQDRASGGESRRARGCGRRRGREAAAESGGRSVPKREKAGLG